MTPERWRQVSEVFHAARARDAAARASYLEHACAGDGALRAEVDANAAAHNDPGGFGDQPVSGSIDDVRRLDQAAWYSRTSNRTPTQSTRNVSRALSGRSNVRVCRQPCASFVRPIRQSEKSALLAR